MWDLVLEVTQWTITNDSMQIVPPFNMFGFVIVVVVVHFITIYIIPY